MHVQLGNVAAKNADGGLASLGAPSVTDVYIPDHYGFDADLDVKALKEHLYDAVLTNSGVTNFENAEALLVVVHADGAWRHHSELAPSWVACDDNPAFAQVVSAWYGGIPVGKPTDVEDTHHTASGPPGVVPGATTDLQALLVNSGRDVLSRALLGGVQGYTGTATGTSATSLTATGTPWTVNAYTGQTVVAGGVYGIIVSNTSSVLTIDRWYTVGSSGSTMAATPSTTTVFSIMPGNSPAFFMGLGYTSTAPAAGDTSMSGEVVNGTPAGEANIAGTLPSGLLRQICPWAHTAGTTTSTLTPVFTGNASDGTALTSGITIYRIGVFTSLIASDTASTMVYETTLSASATLSAVGDQLTVTETVTSV